MGKKLVRCRGCGMGSWTTYCSRCQKSMDFNRIVYNKEQEIITLADLRKERMRPDGGYNITRVG